MNRALLSSAFLVLIFSSAVMAAPPAGSIAYSPDAVNLTLPAGSQGSAGVNIDVINSTMSTYYLRVAASLADGNLPLSWITTAPATVFLTRGTPISTSITVSVPFATPAGTYTGHILSSAMAAHGFADPGTGLRITVTVPPVCSGMPAFTIDSYEPAVLWPPDHRIDTVTVHGSIGMPTGCTLLEAGYAIEDEYGVYTSIRTFTPSFDGTFAIALLLEASRIGRDKDGRHYHISLYARDEAGIITSPTLTVIVPHDHRDCNDRGDHDKHGAHRGREHDDRDSHDHDD